MLLTQCCKNYICHFCVEDLNKKELSFDVACPHCKADPLHVADVDPQSTVKRYSDSPFGTLRPGDSSKKKWLPNLPVVPEDTPKSMSMVIEGELELQIDKAMTM